MKLDEHLNSKRQAVSLEASDDDAGEQEVHLLRIINEALESHEEGKKLIIDFDAGALSLWFPLIEDVPKEEAQTENATK